MNSPYNSGLENVGDCDFNAFVKVPGTFEQQRKERLAETIDEYLNEGDGDVVGQFYQDLRDCITDLAKYHDKRRLNAEEALNAVLGYRPVEELEQNPGMPQGNRL